MEKQYGHIQRLCAIVFPALLLISALLMVSGVRVVSVGSRVTLHLGEVLVICSLTEDVRQTKHGVVIRGPSNSGNDHSDTMLSFDWLADNPDTPDCISHYGFTLKDLEKDHVVASVPRTLLQNGSYTCELVPRDKDRPFTTCLVIHSDDAEDPPTTISAVTPSTAADHPPPRDQNVKVPPGANGDHPEGLVVAVGVLSFNMFFLIVIFMTFFWLLHKRYGIMAFIKPQMDGIRSKRQYKPVSWDEVLQQVTSQDGGAEDAGGQKQVTSQDDGDEDAGGQQQGGSNLPEDVWLKDIDNMYPNLQGQTYFLPPYHFNRVPFTTKVIAGLTAKVTAACCERPQKRAPTSQPQGSPQPAFTSQAQGSQQMAGTLFTQYPPNLQPVEVSLNDAVDDQAQEICMRALHDITGETMMVISQLVIRQYLDNKTNPDADPCHQDAISQLPTPADLPHSLADCDCDILVIHPHHGLLIFEVKSVGRKPFFSEDHTIVKKVKQAIGQLDNLEVAFKHLLNDLPGISISKAVLLPYLTSSQLRSALSSSAQLRQDLIAHTKSVDVDQAISRCLCSDDLKQPGLSAWWQNVWSGSRPHPSPQLYKRLVARFCGVASTVDIPTSSPPRVVVRSLGQAVAETGLRFSALNLTHDQVELLDQNPPHQYLYLQGPPGTGKTLVLFLAALKSALQGKKVVIVHMPGDVAVATLLKLQLTSIMGVTTAAQLIHLHTIDFGDRDLDVNADVATLRQQVGQEDNVHIIVDEVPPKGGQLLPWVTAVGSTWPRALLWMAGLRIRDNTAEDPSDCLPQWLETATLRVSLRCPPTVTDHVAKSGHHVIDDSTIPRYVIPPGPQHTAGPDVRRLRHTPGVDGHTEGWNDFLGCEVCWDNVASVIRELGVGQTGHGLQYRDVFVLAGRYCPAPRDDDSFVRRLQQHHRLPVRVVRTPPSADDALQLATAVEDEMIITDWSAVQGLERRAVFVLGAGGGWTEDCVAFTRTTAFLCCITDPCDDSNSTAPCLHRLQSSSC